MFVKTQMKIKMSIFQLLLAGRVNILHGLAAKFLELIVGFPEHALSALQP